MRVLRWIAVGLVAIVVGIGALAFGARFADGPVALLPGGPFRTGEWVDHTDIDWSFATAVQEIQLESGAPPTSRTTWIVVIEGEAYVPCSLSFPPGKSWHRDALQAPDAVVRIEGKRYRRRLVKVEDEALSATLASAVSAKYPGGSPGGDAWFFHLAAPRT